MKIYEAGNSAYRKAVGLRPNGSVNYVCVVDNIQQTAEEAFAQMEKDLPKKGSADAKLLTVTLPGETYTLAHERLFNKSGEVTLKPSNMLRHLYTRNFNTDAIYIDEDGRVVDITESLHDLNRGTLKCMCDFGEVIKNDPEILFEALYLHIIKSFGSHRDIADGTSEINPSEMPSLKGESIYLSKMLLSDGFGSFNSYLQSCPSLREYLYVRDQLSVSVSFNPNEEYTAGLVPTYIDYVAPPAKSKTPKRKISHTVASPSEYMKTPDAMEALRRWDLASIDSLGEGRMDDTVPTDISLEQQESSVVIDAGQKINLHLKDGEYARTLYSQWVNQHYGDRINTGKNGLELLEEAIKNGVGGALKNEVEKVS